MLLLVVALFVELTRDLIAKPCGFVEDLIQTGKNFPQALRGERLALPIVSHRFGTERLTRA